jgi:hypothetical protein
VGFCGFRSMVDGVHSVPVGDLGVMSGLLVMARFMVLCSFPMMTGSVLVMLGCFRVVMRCFFRHR